MVNLNTKIRNAVEKDYESVNRLYSVSYGLYHQNIPDSYKKPPKCLLSKGTYLNILEDKDCCLKVATDKGAVVGMVYMTIEEDSANEVAKGYKHVSVDEISVLPEYSRIGIGSLLMSEVENWAKSKNIYEISTLTYDFNKPAINFYEKKGFKPYSIVLKKKLR